MLEWLINAIGTLQGSIWQISIIVIPGLSNDDGLLQDCDFNASPCRESMLKNLFLYHNNKLNH